MAVPTEYQAVFSRWCAERVPSASRDCLQVGYRMHGDEVTFALRRPPTYPELNSAWTSRPVAQLRYNDPEPGFWRIYRPTADGWAAYRYPPAITPEPLLAEIVADPTSTFWGRGSRGSRER